MSGKLLQAARLDALKFVKSGGFEEDITLIHVSGTPTVEIKGLHNKHWSSYDSDGNPTSSKTARILINEKDLIDLNYPTRNERTGNVDLKKHKVYVKDSTNIEKKFVIIDTYPSETFGLITCVLGDLKE